jgi:hypothetical protein
MKIVYELDVYNLVEKLSDLVWCDFDKWKKRFKIVIEKLGPKLNAFINSTKIG